MKFENESEESTLKEIYNQLQLRISNLKEINKALEENTKENRKSTQSDKTIVLKRKVENRLQGKEPPDKADKKSEDNKTKVLFMADSNGKVLKLELKDTLHERQVTEVHDTYTTELMEEFNEKY